MCTPSITTNDYYPFGMLIAERGYSSDTVGYRFGFNGKEQDPAVNGQGNQYDYGFRVYNPRIGKFLSEDPLTASYPWYTPYQFAGNKVIVAIDIDGLEEKIIHRDLASNMMGRATLSLVDKTTFGKEFNINLKAQSEFDVYYVPFTSKYTDADGDVFEGTKHDDDGFVVSTGGATGYTFSIKDKADLETQMSTHYSLENVKIDDLEQSFAAGKKVVIITIADMFMNAQDVHDPSLTKKENSEKMINSMASGAATIVHEQTAHAQNRLNNIEKSTSEEHKDYNGVGGILSPTREDVATDPKFEGTKVKKTQDELDRLCDEAKATL